MSAILAKDGAMGPDGIRRYHTTCKVSIHSHVNASFDVSQDVVSIQTSKNIKGTGSATLTLVGAFNYLNLVHPNDYINIYFNIGDGSGWTRTFFGYVDMIREKHSVDDAGVPTTHYLLKCSDFQKAFEKTQVYFNPYMVGREDFGGEAFGTANVGGVALMTKGITASGSPAQVIQNLIMMLFGFGSQFTLPSGYGTNTAVVNSNRGNRRKYLEGELGHIARAALRDYDDLKAWIDKTSGDIATSLAGLDTKDAMEVLKAEYNISPGIIEKNKIDLQDIPAITKLIGNAEFRKRVGAGKNSYNEHDPNIIQAIGALDDVARTSLLDVVDAFTFFEDESIDGWVADTGIWQKQGSIGQILRSYSHEEVNEFYFDLRPMVIDSDSEDREYSRLPDEVGGNLGHGGVNGIQYVPSIIMREYPFGTIQRIDASDAKFTVRALEGAAPIPPQTVDTVEVGAMFSDKPNQPGRHVVGQPSLSLTLKATGRQKSATKLLDVAVIHSSEIKTSDIGRSDSDHFNLFEIYSGDFQVTDNKWMMADVLPIVTPIHIMRHGLRTRNYTTRWASFNLTVIGNVERKNSRAGALAAGDVSKAAAPSVPAEPDSSDGVSAAPADLPVVSNATVPVKVNGSTGTVSSAFGYRTRNNNNVVQQTAKVFKNGGSWVHHNGVDIRGDIGEPVYAVMDGVMVASVPNGVYTGYGQTIIIKHKLPDGRIVYSQYSHLSKREIGGENMSQRKLDGQAFNGGTLPLRAVKAGQQIGAIGITRGSPKDKDKLFTHGNAHLHFEYLTGWGNRVYPSKDTKKTGRFPNGRFVVNVPIAAGSPVTPAPTDKTPRCLDPEVVQAQIGAPLTSNLSTKDEEDDLLDAEDQAEDSSAADPGGALNKEHLEAKKQGVDAAYAIDTVSTRKQILRWGLLQDHWYQHNLEYLSGQITMRGAPEIRAGYRLDIEDRNLSFYVDGVSMAWQFPDNGNTVLTVSRGQSNNPHPMYVMPPMPAFVSNSGEQRGDGSRLSMFQITPDPLSVNRAIVFRNSGDGSTYIPGANRSDQAAGQHVNSTDLATGEPTVSFAGGPPGTGKAVLDTEYGDYVIYPQIESTPEGDSGIAPELAPALDELFPKQAEGTAGLDNIDGQSTPTNIDEFFK